MPYSFLRSVTTHHAKCGAGDSVNYPIAIFGTYAWLKDVAHGGQVENVNGYDVGFFTNSDATGKLDWEVESYNPATGEVAYWVKIPVLSHTTDIVFYIMYGDATITTDQSNKTAVWDANYVGVWHFATMPVGPTCDVTDSTVYARTDLVHNGSPIGGTVDGAIGAPGLGGYPSWSDTGLPDGASPRTIEFWVNSVDSGPIIAYGTDLASELIFIGTVGSGADLLVRTLSSGPPVAGFALPTPISASPHQITVTFTGALCSIYEDGVLCPGQGNLTAILNTVRLGHIALCHSNDSQGFGQIGATVDELRISNVVRSTNYITASYNNQFDPATFYTISGVDTPFTASCGNPPLGIFGVTYNHTFPAPTDGGVAPFIWGLLHRDHTALVPEDVLDGIPLASNGSWIGLPDAIGVFPFSLVIVDVNEVTAYVDCTLTVVNVVTAQCNNPCDAVLGVLYNHAFSTAGGSPPFTWVLTAGTLPDGLTLASTGIVSGIATAVGTFPITVQVTDSIPNTSSVDCTLTVTDHVCPWQLCGLFTISGDCALDVVPTPVAPVVTAEGVTGFCNYSYALVARNSLGTTHYSAPGTTLFGSCTPLTSLAFNEIATVVATGVDSYDIWRTDSESFPDMPRGLIGNVLPGVSFFDTGQTPTLPLSELPVVNTTGQNGVVGLRRVADGSLGTSDVVSSTPITVSAGQVYYIEFHLKGSGGANGTIGVGFDFYDATNTYLSSAYVTSTGSPVIFTTFTGTVTVPFNAVSAVPVVKAVDHLVGTWCIAALFAVLLDSNFSLSSIKSYFSEFAGYR